MEKLKIYRQVKAETNAKQRRAAMLEELLELRERIDILTDGISSGKYIDNRHSLCEDVMPLWSEIADVIQTTEQNLNTTAGLETVEAYGAIALIKLRGHLEKGTLLDGLPEVL